MAGIEYIEVGMYVRTRNGIKQIYKIDNHKTKWKYYFKLKKQDGDGCIDLGSLSKEDIIGEPNFDIIDLIEVGDYVNGMEVTRITGTRYDENDLHCYCEKNGDENWKQVMIPAKNIKSIVTKEQFEQMSYKVGN